MNDATSRPFPLTFWRVFPLVFVFIFLLHAPLLRLPFFWDEAGYYVPAAYDLAHSHSLIPRTTLDTGHPPLSAAYLALWFTLSGWKPAVARVAMLLLAAFGLTNLFLLARRLTRTGVAVATTIATAVYPIFFVQSSLTHADLAAAALTLWGLRLYLERRTWPAQLAFLLAVLSKETAIITPFAVTLWELLPSHAAPAQKRMLRAATSLLPAAALAAWLLYHHHATGRFLGGADFYQYNVANVLSVQRFLQAFKVRTWHLFGTLGMLALTVATAAAMIFRPVSDNGHVRPRIEVRVQLLFYLIMLLNLVTFSLIGGALLTRYLLSAYPLVVLIGVSTLHRRIARWEWPVALIVIFFVLGLFFDPPYHIAPEDNLRYRDFVQLHYRAAQFLQQHEQGKTVLSAWPATDELARPYLGYVRQQLPMVSVHDFSVEELVKAQQMRSQYQVAYVFSTKYETAPPPPRMDEWEKLHQRFFDYHRDVQPEVAADFLHAKIVYIESSHAEWVAIMELQPPSALGATSSPR